MAENLTNYFAIDELRLSQDMRADEIQKELNRVDEQLSRQAVSSDRERSARARELIGTLERARADLATDDRVAAYKRRLTEEVYQRLVMLARQTAIAFSETHQIQSSLNSGQTCSPDTKREVSEKLQGLLREGEQIRAFGCMTAEQKRAVDALAEVAKVSVTIPLDPNAVSRALDVSLDPCSERFGGGKNDTLSLMIAEFTVMLWDKGCPFYDKYESNRLRKNAEALTECPDDFLRDAGFLKLVQYKFSIVFVYDTAADGSVIWRAHRQDLAESLVGWDGSAPDGDVGLYELNIVKAITDRWKESCPSSSLAPIYSSQVANAIVRRRKLVEDALEKRRNATVAAPKVRSEPSRTPTSGMASKILLGILVAVVAILAVAALGSFVSMAIAFIAQFWWVILLVVGYILYRKGKQ